MIPGLSLIWHDLLASRTNGSFHVPLKCWNNSCVVLLCSTYYMGVGVGPQLFVFSQKTVYLLKHPPSSRSTYVLLVNEKFLKNKDQIAKGKEIGSESIGKGKVNSAPSRVISFEKGIMRQDSRFICSIKPPYSYCRVQVASSQSSSYRNTP